MTEIHRDTLVRSYYRAIFAWNMLTLLHFHNTLSPPAEQLLLSHVEGN